MSQDVIVPNLESMTLNYSGVVPAEHAVLTGEQRDLLKRLDGFEAPYLEEKLLANNKFQNSSNYREAFVEFKKYAGLSQVVSGPLGMSSQKVDEVWHQFILFTKQYADFCENYLGDFLHHSPNTSHTPLAKEATRKNFVNAYRSVFGELPEIWNSNSGMPCTECCEDGCSPIE